MYLGPTNEPPRHKRSVRRIESKFIPGGNITDPLNIRHVKPGDPVDEFEKPIDVKIPRNVHDPLNLLSKRSAKKHKKYLIIRPNIFL